MKKIVLASAAMGGAALVAFGAAGTFAAFSDEATVSNGAGAGTLFLNTTDNTSTTVKSDALSLAPGESASFAYYAANGGDVVGDLSFDFMVPASSNIDDGCLDVEKRAGDNCNNGVGELPGVAFTSVYGVAGVISAANCTTAVARPTDPIIRGTWQEIETELDEPALIAADLGKDEGICLLIDIDIPNEDVFRDIPINQVQSDRAVFEVVLTLDQAFA